jgi:hypothetical protein
MKRLHHSNQLDHSIQVDRTESHRLLQHKGTCNGNNPNLIKRLKDLLRNTDGKESIPGIIIDNMRFWAFIAISGGRL